MPARNHEAYRDYLEPKYLDEFDAWRDRYRNPFKDLTTGTRDRNWNDERRIAELEDDGVVAEVVFPNTIPPFFPTGAVVARRRRPEEYELRLAGVRAHNRWLADWCARHPSAGRASARSSSTTSTTRWMTSAGATSTGFVAGSSSSPSPTIWRTSTHSSPSGYDPLWALCEELGVVVNTHSGGAGMPDYGRHRASSQAWIAEATFFSRRPLTHMLISGAFERFPALRFVVTETGCSWIPGVLEQLDTFHRQMRTTGRIGELRYDPDDVPPLSPSEYFARNCWVGVSFPSPAEAMTRHVIGADRFMWGSDYPHDESTYPNTREGLRRAFAGTDPVELQQLLAGNAATVYGFDLDALAPLAARCGPTVEELAVPYEGVPEENRSPAFVKA